ncbi:DUF3244 domain-containing protein [Dyadobacter sp. 3J3]|uniref:DUF3244 domain-containing protein n=1 Tax=Dyadobacter sp. 3J3 TaxID=2606600 RepID=UPI00135A3AAA|nr:hypothetical protein [Dyadobacter sp. 3J3]
MKTYIKNIAVAFAFVASFAFSAHADDKATKKASVLNTGVYINKNGKINVFVDKLNSNSNTTIVVKNSAGDVVYREVVEKDLQKFGRILNVDELTAGKYEIKVSSKNDSQTKSFQLSEPVVERVVTIK